MAHTTPSNLTGAVNIASLLPEKHFKPLYRFNHAEATNTRNTTQANIVVPSPMAKTIIATTRAINALNVLIITALAVCIPLGIVAIVSESMGSTSATAHIQNQQVPHTTLLEDGSLTVSYDDLQD